MRVAVDGPLGLLGAGFIAMAMTVMIFFIVVTVISPASLTEREVGLFGLGLTLGLVLFGFDDQFPLKDHRGSATIGGLLGLAVMGQLLLKRSRTHE